MLTGYEHIINSEGWFTNIGAQLWAASPEAAAVIAGEPEDSR